MLTRLKQSWLVWSLLLALVLVNGLLAVPAVVHVGHHAKHDAGTHSTGLCAWQCVAGQESEASADFPEVIARVAAFAELISPRQGELLFSARVFLRGPPAVIR